MLTILLEWKEYSKVKPETWGLRIVQNKEKLPWTVYLGAVGMPGETAYYAWKEFVPKEQASNYF
jgi:NADPH-dependent curcumin reductase CurA